MSYLINEKENFMHEGANFRLVKRNANDAIVEDENGKQSKVKRTEYPQIWNCLLT